MSRLREDSVEVWFQPVAKDMSEADELKHLALLSPPELEAFNKRTHPRARSEYLVTRATLRRILARYLDLDPLDFQFETGTHGRPRVAKPLVANPIHFSVSHSHGLLGIAFSFEQNIGLDLDCFTRSVDVANLASSVFSESELQDVMAQNEDERKRKFFSYWTLKEAYLKALELGLSKELTKISFALSKDGRSARLP